MENNTKNNKKRFHLGLNCVIGSLALLGSVGTITFGTLWCQSRNEPIPTPEPTVDLRNCVCLENIDQNEDNIFYIDSSSWNSVRPKPEIKYSTNDGQTWFEYNYDEISEANPISIPKGGKIYLRGKNDSFNFADGDTLSYNHYINLKNDDNFLPLDPTMHYINVSGSVMGLLDDGTGTATAIPNDGCFNSLFYGNNSVRNVTDDFLPATELKPACYRFMFAESGSISHIPELNATELPDFCYQSMFDNSSALSEIPSFMNVKTFGNSCLHNFCYGSLACLNIEDYYGGSGSGGMVINTDNWSESELYSTGVFYMFTNYPQTQVNTTYYAWPK